MRLNERQPGWFTLDPRLQYSVATLEAEMNRQKREEAQRNSGTPGKPSDQPGRSNPPDRNRTQNREDAESPERQQPHREPGKLPLPD